MDKATFKKDGSIKVTNENFAELLEESFKNISEPQKY